MAKKHQDLSGIFKKTDPASTTARPDDPAAAKSAPAVYDLSGNIRSIGVGLTTGEVAALQAIAEANNISRNALTRWAIRYFLRQAIAGRVRMSDFKTETKPAPDKLRLP